MVVGEKQFDINFMMIITLVILIEDMTFQRVVGNVDKSQISVILIFIGKMGQGEQAGYAANFPLKPII